MEDDRIPGIRTQGMLRDRRFVERIVIEWAPTLIAKNNHLSQLGSWELQQYDGGVRSAQERHKSYAVERFMSCHKQQP